MSRARCQQLRVLLILFALVVRVKIIYLKSCGLFHVLKRPKSLYLQSWFGDSTLQIFRRPEHRSNIHASIHSGLPYNTTLIIYVYLSSLMSMMYEYISRAQEVLVPRNCGWCFSPTQGGLPWARIVRLHGWVSHHVVGLTTHRGSTGVSLIDGMLFVIETIPTAPYIIPFTYIGDIH